MNSPNIKLKKKGERDKNAYNLLPINTNVIKQAIGQNGQILLIKKQPAF